MIKNSLLLIFHSPTNLTFYYCLIVRGWHPQVCKGHRSVPVFALSVVLLDFVCLLKLKCDAVAGPEALTFLPWLWLGVRAQWRASSRRRRRPFKRHASIWWVRALPGRATIRSSLPLERKRRLATEAKSQSVLGWQGRETPPHPAASGNVQCEVFSDFL